MVRMMASGDLTILNAAVIARIVDRGAARSGPDQGELDLLENGGVAVRDGRIVAVGPTEAIASEYGHPSVPIIDATAKTILPGLIECHSHPLFAGERHHEYAGRLGGASLAEVAARGGGIWSSVMATRNASDADLLRRLELSYARILSGGVTTLEVKSGYGLTAASELHQLDLLAQSRALTPIELMITFLGAHVVPRDIEGPRADDRYTDLVSAMLPGVLAQGIAQFQDVTVEDGLFTPAHALRLMAQSHDAGLTVRVHADAWKPSHGWETAVEGRAISAEHLTYTPDDEIRRVGKTDTVAVVLPMAELVYMTDRRANARLFIDNGVPLAVATDYCSSIHATSLINTVAVAAPWFRITPAEAIVAATLNAAYALGRAAECGSLDNGKRADLLIVDVPHPNEICLAAGAPIVDVVIAGGTIVAGSTVQPGDRR